MTLPAEPLPSALDRVRASRERLRLAMTPPPRSRPDSAGAANSWIDALTAKLRELPVVGAVVESVQAWWAAHPARPATRVAGEAVRAAVQPVARHHPWLLVLASFLGGALLIRARPWTLIFRSAIFAGLLPQLATRALTRMPLDSWLAMLNASLSRGPAPATAAAAGPIAEPAMTG